MHLGSGCMTSYYSTTQFYIEKSTTTNASHLRQYQLTDLTNGGVRALIELGQDDNGRSPHITPVGDRKEDNRTVSRT